MNYLYEEVSSDRFRRSSFMMEFGSESRKVNVVMHAGWSLSLKIGILRKLAVLASCVNACPVALSDNTIVIICKHTT